MDKILFFKCKQQKSILNIIGLKNSMKFKYQTEKYINISNGKINSFWNTGSSGYLTLIKNDMSVYIYI